MQQLSRRTFLSAGAAGLAGAAFARPLSSALAAAPDGRKRNVLFIAVDDLKPALGCYGDKTAISPNIDRLAARGTVFTRAYCQQAVCSPSRTSLMTGRRPDTTRVFDLETHFRDTIPDVVTLPQQFMKEGYHAASFSKIYHGSLNDKLSWSVPHWRPRRQPYYKPENNRLLARLRKEARAKGLDMRLRRNRVRGPAWEDPDVADNALADGATADEAIRVLGEIKDRPFFLAVGFLKPHLPFIAPKKYWDLYDRDKLQLADNPYPPKDAPPFAMTNWGELRAYHGIPKTGPLADEQALRLIHGYYACVSYTDAQIGRLLGALERFGVLENTVIVLWGDHGWHLGDHGQWCKHTNFEEATHSPLILSAPGRKTAGSKCDALVEFVDIYPSLCELCDVPLPEGLEGTSVAPLLENPRRPWKTAAFSQYPRFIRGQGRGMGYSMRTDRYRFTEWRVDGKDYRAYELYDHKVDPQENVNIAGLPENKELVMQLTKQLAAGWRGARPPRR